MNKIFCFGDGYATGHIWPEWPQILQALLPDKEVITIAGIGSGDEWLTTRFVQELAEIAGNTVIFQWPQIGRFDKLIEDQSWENIAKRDPIYYFNFYKNHKQTWWLSSASKCNEVKTYHALVQSKQQHCRQVNYKTLIEHTLQNLNCVYFFTSTNEQELFSQQTRFVDSRQTEVQPSPIVHFYFVKEVILPKIQCHSTNIDRLEDLILKQRWIAYDPDRQPIWEHLTAISRQ